MLMLWSSSLITGSALVVGVRVYKENKKKKEMPWTYMAENMRKGKKKRIVDLKIVPQKKGAIASFFEARHTQLKEISSTTDDNQKSQTQRKLTQNLAIASSSLGLASMGALFYPPLSVLSWPGFFYISKHGFADAYETLVERHTVGTDLLASVVKILLFVNGHYVLCNLSAVIYTLNRKLLYEIKDNSKKNVIDVFRRSPRSVFVLSDGYEIEVPFKELKVGDIVIVNAGETIPIDGMITNGVASVDQHVLTGESQPVEKKGGDQVFALTVVLSGRIYIQVEKAGEETTAAQIGEILNQTVDFKTSMQLWAEAMTNKTVLPTLLIGTSLIPIVGPMSAIAFLYSHPKYKTTVASSVSVLGVLNVASQKGILIKDGRTFELLEKVDTVIFDKTGTLTQEQPHVGRIHGSNGFTEEKVLWYAAAAEYKQSHPIARAILKEARAQKLNLPEIDEAEYKVGYGISMRYQDQVVRVGSIRFIEMESMTIPSEIRVIQKDCHREGHTLVLVALENTVIGAVELQATVRPEAFAVIQGLRQRNIKSMYIISGDHEAPTKRLAEKLGIDHYFAETLPEQKADIIESLQQEGKSICYIGDGINDAIALKKAQVSVSLRGASTVAIDTAQVVLMDQSLRQLGLLFDIARQFQTNMKKTFAIVFIPHAIALTGSLFLQFSFLNVFILRNMALFAGVTHAMLPLLPDQSEK